jgi:hypothetical protein
MAEQTGGPYSVVYSGLQRQAVRAYGERAAQRGILAAYLDAIRSMHDHLTTDPLDWGDPQNRLRHMGLLLCQRIHRMLLVHYAVDEQRRIVYLRSIRPMPNRGLGDEA